MRSLKLVLLVIGACLLIGLPTRADVVLPVPDPNLCMVWTEAPGPDMLSIVNLPNGEGRRFDEARQTTGVVNGTIFIKVMDALSQPWPFFPHEDLWLEFDDPHMTLCPEGSLADRNTDINGDSWWVFPLKAGGYSQGAMRGVVMGMPIPGGFEAIHFNSPDINADLQVNLSDVALFSQDYWGGTYQYRSDFHHDGVINLQDLAIMAAGLGASCP